MTIPQHPHNGYRTYLADRFEMPGISPTEKSICAAALYIGEILECICWEAWRTGSRRGKAKWFPEKEE
jgi:hypothetical protein